MNMAIKDVWVIDPHHQKQEPLMEFRITYRGNLFASQGDARNGQTHRRAQNMHEIRKAIHPQLRRLWEITPFLKAGEGSGSAVLVVAGMSDPPDYRVETLAHKHAHYGFNFVPLVTRDLNLLCDLDILFLRPEPPGHVLRSGDIDNRLKTLFDAFRIPQAGEKYTDRTPADDEKPMFVLLEDDGLITKLAVETDRLLDLSNSDQINTVSLVITVRLRPYEMTINNMQFG
jgi:hypothetical protein